MWNPDRLRTARIHAGLTQEALARQINCSLTALRNWERGRMIPSFNAVALIAWVLKKPLDYFNEGG